MQADVALSVPATFFSMSSRRHKTGVKSMVGTVMWWMAGAGDSLIKRTLFLALVSPIVAANIRAFSVVCRKSRSRWCSRKYWRSSAEATPSSKRRFKTGSRWSRCSNQVAR